MIVMKMMFDIIHQLAKVDRFSYLVILSQHSSDELVRLCSPSPFVAIVMIQSLYIKLIE